MTIEGFQRGWFKLLLLHPFSFRLFFFILTQPNLMMQEVARGWADGGGSGIKLTYNGQHKQRCSLWTLECPLFNSRSVEVAKT